MFNWFWDFLYSISEIVFELIDALLAIANKLCGIDPISVGGKQTNFMVEMLEDSRIFMGFAGAALIGIFLLMIFSVIAICRNMADGKKSNSHIAVQVFKTLGLFFLVPTLMIGFTVVLNELVILLYRATSSTTPSLGAWLFENFLPDGMEGFEGSYDWQHTSSVREYMASAGYDLSDFRFFFSWIVSIPLLVCIARTLLMFVERCLSIVILFIMSPVSLSTTVLDDGQRFKLWRDKVITKFISGYGMIIALNIYILVLAFITRSDIVFMDDVPLISDKLGNFILRCCFALGGAFFLPKVFGLIGDLFVQGGGGDFANAQQANQGFRGAMSGVKNAIVGEHKRKSEKESKADEKKDKMDNLSKGGKEGGGSSGNGNNPANKVSETGKKVGDILKGEQNEKGGGNDSHNNSASNEFDKGRKDSVLDKGSRAMNEAVDKGKETGKKIATAITGAPIKGAGGSGNAGH